MVTQKKHEVFFADHLKTYLKFKYSYNFELFIFITIISLLVIDELENMVINKLNYVPHFYKRYVDDRILLYTRRQSKLYTLKFLIHITLLSNLLLKN